MGKLASMKAYVRASSRAALSASAAGLLEQARGGVNGEAGYLLAVAEQLCILYSGMEVYRIKQLRRKDDKPKDEHDVSDSFSDYWGRTIGPIHWNSQVSLGF